MIENIKSAILQATGFQYEQYKVERWGESSRKEDHIFLRTIFVHHCDLIGLHHTEITELIGRKRCDIGYMIKKYHEFILSSGKFRVTAYHTNWYLRQIKEMDKYDKERIGTSQIEDRAESVSL